MNIRYPDVASRAGNRCEYCHAPEAVFNCLFEVEHIKPSSLDGSDEESNMALACRACNLRKSAHVTSFDPDSNTEVSLFHPRVDSWDAHFQADLTTARIEGRTAMGRATVICLAVNSDAQMEARRHWIRLDLFA